MLANHAVYTFSPLPAPAPASPCPLAGQGLRHMLKRRTSVVFDVKMMEDHVYVVVDEEDLVKSHLLLAVREEVDVLKANISKLVDKISALERENEVLKTNASPEVLAQLANKRPPGPTAAGQPVAGHRVA